jgi:hypothetical protein
VNVSGAIGSGAGRVSNVPGAGTTGAAGAISTEAAGGAAVALSGTEYNGAGADIARRSIAAVGTMMDGGPSVMAT